MKIPVYEEPPQPLEMVALWLIFIVGGVGYALAFVIFVHEACFSKRKGQGSNGEDGPAKGSHCERSRRLINPIGDI